MSDSESLGGPDDLPGSFGGGESVLGEDVGEEDAPVVETVPDGDSDLEEEVDDEWTDSSSVGSLTAQDLGFELDALVDLSEPDRFCLVLMSRQARGERIVACCGCPRASCTRRGHKKKQDTIHQAPPAFYEGLVTDGRSRQA